jgi:ABC-type Fe3+-hydroxamate transport system substrate-binding protein
LISITDQTGCILHFNSEVNRIVSLVPSLTETLADLGVAYNICGITKFCVHPNDLKSRIKIIGGTKNPGLEKIIALKPDLIIANKEENRQEDINHLRQHAQVYVSDIKNFGDILEFLKFITRITSGKASQELALRIQNLKAPDYGQKFSVCYLIWQAPYMSVGNDTFIHFMLERYGFTNIFSTNTRYPEINIQEIRDLNPYVIMLSSEPYPFREKHKSEFQSLFPGSRVVLVDGEMFSWYGSRILHADTYIKNLYIELMKKYT